MAAKNNDKSKVVLKNANNTNLDIRIVHKHEGLGKQRRIIGSSYGIFSAKKNVKGGFKNSEMAVDFLMENYRKYDRKSKKFKH